MESATNLREALNVLKKSSPQAVEVERPDRSRDILKKYLYIETSIERDFRKRLESIESGQIIFLCGSSGDGKSAILTRYSNEYAHKANFHLDATHSSAPTKMLLRHSIKFLMMQRRVVGLSLLVSILE